MNSNIPSACLMLLLVFLNLKSLANTLYVPAQFNTIQSAINASINNDTILVSPGIYNEAINFNGKAILIKSIKGPAVTRITASSLYIVTFESGEDNNSILSGFSIGPEDVNFHSNWNGILCSSSSPTIVRNIIERMKRAIMIVKGSPIIKRNIIQENIWFENTSGIFVIDTCNPVIVNNIISGYYQGIRISGSIPTILFNTIDQNKYGIFGADSCIIINNIITNGNYGIFSTPSSKVIISHNNVWNNGIQSYDLNYQNCDTGEGDISKDPMFTESSPFRLQENSPCIDTGIDAGISEDFNGYQRPAGNGYDIGAFEYGSITAVKEIETVNPNSFFIEQNYPNPFNPTTSINYSIPEISLVTLRVYDILGREVITLVNEEKYAGNYSVVFNGSEFSSGVYIYTIKANKYFNAKKFVLIK